MKSKETVGEIIETRGVTRAYLAKKLGYSGPSSISERLSKDPKTDLRVDTLVKFLEALDCTLVVRSNLKDKKEWVIDA